jgi:hypothetical protein
MWNCRSNNIGYQVVGFSISASGAISERTIFHYTNNRQRFFRFQKDKVDKATIAKKRFLVMLLRTQSIEFGSSFLCFAFHCILFLVFKKCVLGNLFFFLFGACSPRRISGYTYIFCFPSSAQRKGTPFYPHMSLVHCKILLFSTDAVL